MKIRLGFVAMSVHLKNASPSKTMTVTNFEKVIDREVALRKLTRIAAENLQNTLRVLRHANAHDIKLYRFTSKFIPLIGHELTEDWNFWGKIGPEFEEVGAFVRDHGMRVSFHPDHFTVLNSKSREVIENSLADLDRHVKMFELMGLDEKAKMVMHVGAGNKNKEESIQRFETEWENVPHRIRNRLMLENDDKTFTVSETLGLCERLDIPMVLDIHHHRCNPGEDDLRELTPRIFKLWEGTGLPPKIHVSSPKNEKDFRHHADYIDANDLIPFLDLVRELGDTDLDIMVEAKQKDDSVMRLADDLEKRDGFKRLNGASFTYRA
ncbi:MAG: UV DNA damage repair endonuclease UvsE [Tumebacillaceae bacterium]